jgi:hypothetical protein
LRSLVDHCRDLRRLVIVGACDGASSSAGADALGSAAVDSSVAAGQDGAADGSAGGDGGEGGGGGGAAPPTTPGARRRAAAAAKKRQQRSHGFGGGDFYSDERLTARVGKASGAPGGLRGLGERRPLLVVVRAKKDLVRE